VPAHHAQRVEEHGQRALLLAERDERVYGDAIEINKAERGTRAALATAAATVAARRRHAQCGDQGSDAAEEALAPHSTPLLGRHGLRHSLELHEACEHCVFARLRGGGSGGNNRVRVAQLCVNLAAHE
jgi:hypothetical protein